MVIGSKPVGITSIRALWIKKKCSSFKLVNFSVGVAASTSPKSISLFCWPKRRKKQTTVTCSTLSNRLWICLQNEKTRKNDDVAYFYCLWVQRAAREQFIRIELNSKCDNKRVFLFVAAGFFSVELVLFCKWERTTNARSMCEYDMVQVFQIFYTCLPIDLFGLPRTLLWQSCPVCFFFPCKDLWLLWEKHGCWNICVVH